MSSRLGANTSKTSRPPGSSSEAAARSARSFCVLVGHVEQRAERDGHERDALVDGRLAQVAEAEVDERRRRPRAPRTPVRRASIAGDSSTPITRTPAFATGTAIRPVPTASSTTGPPEATRLLDVELDVLVTETDHGS